MKKISNKIKFIESCQKDNNDLIFWEDRLMNIYNSFGLEQLHKLSRSLDMLSTFIGRKSVSDLIETNECNLDGIQYKYWALKFDYAFFEKRRFLNPIIKQKDLSTNYTDTANVLAAMIAINNSTMAWDAAEMLKNMLFNEGYVYKLHLENSSFEPFMYWLSQKQLGNALPNLSQFKLRVYQDMIDCWDGDNFYPTLEKLIYYHIDNMDDNDKFGQDQFRKSPFDLMFFELFAILKVANKPIPDFSVIDPFFSKLNNMTSIELQPDEVISKIETLFYETF